jgi:hypothetical protein
MSRGGKRTGVGRKRLEETDLCKWIVNRIRQHSNSPEFTHARQLQYIKKVKPKLQDEFIGLHDAYKKLEALDTPARKNLIEKRIREDDAGTVFEEIREALGLEVEVTGSKTIHKKTITLDADGYEVAVLPQYYQLPTPNQFLMSELYESVACEASLAFNRRVTKRHIKDCVGAWSKFEKSLKEL